MSQIKYRSATLADLPVLLEFEQGIIAAERPFDPTLKPDPISYYDLKELIQSDESEVLVAEVDAGIVGSGYAQIRNANSYQLHDRFAYLGFMFVKPEFRGNGIITVLIEKLKEWSLSQGLAEIRLDVYSENAPAVKAYEKAGFSKNLVEMRMALS